MDGGALSEFMRVGEFIFECIQTANNKGGMTKEFVLLILDVLREEIKYCDSPGQRHLDMSTSQSLELVCQALAEIWVYQPRGLTLRSFTSRQAKMAPALIHMIKHVSRIQLQKMIDSVSPSDG